MSTSKLVRSAVVAWSSVETPPKLSAGSVQIKLIPVRSATISNKFLLGYHVKNNAALIVYPGVYLSGEDVEYMVAVWRDNQQRIVGPFARAAGIPDSIKGRYRDSYSIVSTRAALMHRRLLLLYASQVRLVREVDGLAGCDDVAMNMLAAKETGLPPLQVIPSSEASLGAHPREEEDRACIAALAPVLRSNPLVATRLQAAQAKQNYSIKLVGPNVEMARAKDVALSLQDRFDALPQATGVIVSFRRRANTRAIVCEAIRDYAPLLAEFIVVNNDVERPMERDAEKEMDCAGWEAEQAMDAEAGTGRKGGQGYKGGREVEVGVGAGGTGAATRVPIRVINNPYNSFTMARYTGCREARTELCFVVDDDYRPKHLRALVSAYTKHPGRVVVATDVSYAHLNSRWTFFEPHRRLHAGFAWLGTGAVLPREQVLRFLTTMKRIGATLEMQRFADLYFTLLVNQVPLSLQTALVQEGLDTADQFSCTDCTAHLRQRSEHQQVALSVLQRCLDSQLQLPEWVEVQEEGGTRKAAVLKETPRAPDGSALAPLKVLGSVPFDCGIPHVFATRDWTLLPEKAICQRDDCVFLSSIDSQVDGRQQNRVRDGGPSDPNGYPAAKDAQASAMFPQGWAVRKPSVQFAAAVDGDLRSAWKPGTRIPRQAWFGLGLVHHSFVRGLLVGLRGEPLHPNDHVVEVQDLENRWKRLNWRVSRVNVQHEAEAPKSRLHAMAGADQMPKDVRVFRLMFSGGPQWTAGVRIRFIKGSKYPIEVFEMAALLAVDDEAIHGSRQLVVTSGRRQSSQGILDSEPFAVAHVLAEAGPVDLLLANTPRIPRGDLRKVVEHAGRLGIRVFEQPASVPGRSPAPKTDLHTAMHAFLSWLQARENHYEVVFFDGHFPVPELALRRRVLGLQFLRTAFVALATSSVRDRHREQGRFLDSSADMFATVAEHSTRQMADVIVYPTPEDRVQDIRVNVKARRIAIMPPPMPGASDVTASRPPAAGSAAERTLVVVETESTTEVMLQQLLHAVGAARSQQEQESELQLLSASGSDGQSARASPGRRVISNVWYYGRRLRDAFDRGVVEAIREQVRERQRTSGLDAQPAGAMDGSSKDAFRSFDTSELSMEEVLQTVPQDATVVLAPVSRTEASLVARASQWGIAVLAPARYAHLMDGPSCSTYRDDDIGDMARALVEDGGEECPAGTSGPSASALLRRREAIRAMYRRLAAIAVFGRDSEMYVAPLKLPQQTRPLVSVCIPNYNRGEELLATVRSVLDSTYKRLQIIVVDDGSSEEERATFAEVRRLIKPGGGMLLERNHLGASGARNFAASKATGELLYFFDNDDYLLPRTIEKMVAAMYREGADVVTTWVETFRNPDPTAVEVQEEARHGQWCPFGDVGPLSMFVNTFGAGSALHRAYAFRDVGGYTQVAQGVAYQDYNLFSKLKNAGKGILLLPEVGYLYRAASRGSIFNDPAKSVGRSRRNALGPFLHASVPMGAGHRDTFRAEEEALWREFSYGAADVQDAGNQGLDYRMQQG